MTEACEFCGEADSAERGEPMYYEDEDIYAHIGCAIENEVGQE